jgi:hypothetical protein
MENKKLRGKAICPNCQKKHFTTGKRVERRYTCLYWISAVDYKTSVYK